MPEYDPKKPNDFEQMYKNFVKEKERRMDQLLKEAMEVQIQKKQKLSLQSSFVLTSKKKSFGQRLSLE
jgi:hypothetical protein